MRLFGAAAVLLVFFSAQAAEKKTADPRAFRLPKKDAPAKPAPAKPAEKPAPAKPAPAAKKTEPAVPATAFELPNRKADETDGTNEKAATPASNESHESQSPEAQVTPTPEAAPAPPATPAPTAAAAKTVSTPAPAPRFTLPGHKPAPVKKRNPASFRLPEKKD
jgi:hypothetical protein